MQQDTWQCNLCGSHILARCFDIHTRACSKKFSKSTIKKYPTKTNPNDLIPCAECGEMVDFGVFAIHMEECVGRQLSKCVKCKLLFPIFLIEQHNAVCNTFRKDSKEEIMKKEMSDDEEDEDLRQMIKTLAKNNSKDSQQPLSLQTINSLKKIVVLQSEECSICYCQITKSSAIIRLNCPHKYHTRCLTAWLQKNPQCPMCRRHALY